MAYFLRDTVIQLREGLIDCINFHQFENIKISGFRTFKLIKAPKYMDPGIKLRRDKKNGLDIIWSENDNGLEYTLHLINCMIEEDSPGHQHLGAVELSYKE